MRFLQSEIDMSSGVVTSPLVFPPELSNLQNPLISLKKVEPSGISVDEITSAEYMKLNTYATGNVSKNIVDTLALDINVPFKYGYNELFANDPSNITGFNSNATNLTYTGQSQNVANAIGSQSTCDGAYFSNSLFLNGMRVPSFPPAVMGGPTMFTDDSSLNLWDLSASFKNDDGLWAPYAAGPDFEKIDGSGTTFIDNLLLWAGVSDLDASPDLSFSKLQNNDLMVSKLRYLLSIAKVFKLEKLMHYGILDLPCKYVVELMTNVETLADSSDKLVGLDLSGNLANNQFPTFYSVMNDLSNLVVQAVEVNGQATSEALPITLALRLLGRAVYNNIVHPIDLSYGNGLLPLSCIGQVVHIYLLHMLGILTMCKDNVATSSQITALKGLSLPFFDNSFVAHNVECSLDLTPVSELPSILKDVPVFEDLFYKLNNTFVVKNNIHLCESTVSLMNTPMGPALINMYKDLYQNLVDNSLNPTGNALLTLKEFWKVTFLPSYLTGLANIMGCYRTKPIGTPAYSTNLLTNQQNEYLKETTNAINYKLLTEFESRSSNTEYKFTRGVFGGPKTNSSGYASIGVELLSSTDCACA